MSRLGQREGGPPEPAAKGIVVEVVYATAEEQRLVSVEIDANSTVADAVNAAFSGHLDRQILDSAPVGVWGRRANRDLKLKSGDRVELYRPLQRDPREARREIAAAKGQG